MCLFAWGALQATGDEALPQNVTAASEALVAAYDAGHWKAAWQLAHLVYQHGVHFEQSPVAAAQSSCSTAIGFAWHFIGEHGGWVDTSYDALELLTAHGGVPAPVSAAPQGANAEGPQPWAALLDYVFMAEQGSITGGLNAGWMLQRGQGWPRRGAWPGISDGAGAAPDTVADWQDVHSQHAVSPTHAGDAASAASEQDGIERDIEVEIVGYGEHAPDGVTASRLALYYYGRVARTNASVPLLEYANMLASLQPWPAEAPRPRKQRGKPSRSSSSGHTGGHSFAPEPPLVQTIDGTLSMQQQAGLAAQLYERAAVHGTSEAATHLAWCYAAGLASLANFTAAEEQLHEAVHLAETTADVLPAAAALLAMRTARWVAGVLPHAQRKAWQMQVQRIARQGLQLPGPIHHLVSFTQQMCVRLFALGKHAFGVKWHLALGPPGVLAQSDLLLRSCECARFNACRFSCEVSDCVAAGALTCQGNVDVSVATGQRAASAVMGRRAILWRVTALWLVAAAVACCTACVQGSTARSALGRCPSAAAMEVPEGSDAVPEAAATADLVHCDATARRCRRCIIACNCWRCPAQRWHRGCSLPVDGTSALSRWCRNLLRHRIHMMQAGYHSSS